MIEKLIEILNASSADEWQINDTEETGWEFYFIAHKLDQNRVRDVDHVNLTVFKRSEDGETIGSASAEIRQGSNEEQMKKQVETLIERASLVRSRNYELNPPREVTPLSDSGASLKKTAEDYIRLMDEIHETETEDINSHEIFVTEKKERLITSKGIDLTETYLNSMLEAVVNARDKDHEIELYRMYRSGTCPKEQIQKDLYDTMAVGAGRLSAVKTPNLVKCPVLFTGDNAVTLARCFLERTDAAAVYRGFSSWKKDEPYAKDIKGDKATLKALRYLENSPANRSFDKEGAPVRDLTLIEDGVVKSYWGNRMFSYYMGMEDSFIVTNWCLSGGSCTEEQLRSGVYLETAEFSDFQADAVTGDFFGEIRLAWYHDGEKTIPVSGGSVSGNLNELMKEMRMSTQLRESANAMVPSMIRLENVSVTGSEG